MRLVIAQLIKIALAVIDELVRKRYTVVRISGMRKALTDLIYAVQTIIFILGLIVVSVKDVINPAEGIIMVRGQDQRAYLGIDSSAPCIVSEVVIRTSAADPSKLAV